MTPKWRDTGQDRVQNRIDRHTRLVAWAKIILPIMALGLLSTLFLLSRSVDPMATIPFTQEDLDSRTESQQISAPEVLGMTSRGDFVSLKAEFARQNAEDKDLMEAENVRSEIKLTSGTIIDLSAARAEHQATEGTFTLKGDVSARTSTGYRFSLDAIEVSLTELSARSAGAVSGQGPEGGIEAGQLVIEVPEGEKDAHILLKRGVKLIYMPEQNEE